MASDAFSDWVKNTALIAIAISLAAISLDISSLRSQEKELLKLQIEERKLSIQLINRELNQAQEGIELKKKDGLNQKFKA
ncbi:hypothetical protein CGT72_10050 [Vibrio cholerae]|uniref:hypothetical protein n=1 Tax=Vibrio cholerae TaxID=666 RepID=UPI000BA8FD0E|nr:hypothetical protein [Vibrio cholerae]PAS33398.1 hypothetical protein CGT72_10050 [Vibrio cholerae]